jgi:hypothetical protein
VKGDIAWATEEDLMKVEPKRSFFSPAAFTDIKCIYWSEQEYFFLPVLDDSKNVYLFP